MDLFTGVSCHLYLQAFSKSFLSHPSGFDERDFIRALPACRNLYDLIQTTVGANSDVSVRAYPDIY